MTLNDACDYIILQTTEGGEPLNVIKLQKLVYYAQAWHLAFYGRPLFEGKFQAWVHGPVSRELYDRFAATKSLYSRVTREDMQEGFDPGVLPEKERAHIDGVLEIYARFTGSQLEQLTHRERPWNVARGDCRPSDRCEHEIDEDLMREYYASKAELAGA